MRRRGPPRVAGRCWPAPALTDRLPRLSFRSARRLPARETRPGRRGAARPLRRLRRSSRAPPASPIRGGRPPPRRRREAARLQRSGAHVPPSGAHQLLQTQVGPQSLVEAAGVERRDVAAGQAIPSSVPPPRKRKTCRAGAPVLLCRCGGSSTEPRRDLPAGVGASRRVSSVSCQHAFGCWRSRRSGPPGSATWSGQRLGPPGRASGPARRSPREVHRGLPGGIPPPPPGPAILAPAHPRASIGEARYDTPRPSKPGRGWNLRAAAVAGARGDDHRCGRRRSGPSSKGWTDSAGRVEAPWAQDRARSPKRRHRELGAELLGLGEKARPLRS